MSFKCIICIKLQCVGDANRIPRNMWSWTPKQPGALADWDGMAMGSGIDSYDMERFQ